jgi:hypothetical protein
VSFSVTYLEEPGVVETVHSGVVTMQEMRQVMAATGALAAEHACRRFLIDARELEPGAGSAFDLLKLVELLVSLPPGSIERQAILSSSTTKGVQDIRFVETAARNRGLDVLMFADRDEALAWLSE